MFRELSEDIRMQVRSVLHAAGQLVDGDAEVAGRAWGNLALLEEREGNLDAAVTAYQIAIALASKDTIANRLLNFGELLADKLAQPAEAEQLYRRALSLSINDRNTASRLALPSTTLRRAK